MDLGVVSPTMPCLALNFVHQNMYGCCMGAVVSSTHGIVYSQFMVRHHISDEGCEGERSFAKQ